MWVVVQAIIPPKGLFEGIVEFSHGHAVDDSGKAGNNVKELEVRESGNQFQLCRSAFLSPIVHREVSDAIGCCISREMRVQVQELEFGVFQDTMLRARKIGVASWKS